jgi:hypothetical protein
MDTMQRVRIVTLSLKKWNVTQVIRGMITIFQITLLVMAINRICNHVNCLNCQALVKTVMKSIMIQHCTSKWKFSKTTTTHTSRWNWRGGVVWILCNWKWEYTRITNAIQTQMLIWRLIHARNQILKNVLQLQRMLN